MHFSLDIYASTLYYGKRFVKINGETYGKQA